MQGQYDYTCCSAMLHIHTVKHIHTWPFGLWCDNNQVRQILIHSSYPHIHSLPWRIDHKPVSVTRSAAGCVFKEPTDLLMLLTIFFFFFVNGADVFPRMRGISSPSGQSSFRTQKSQERPTARVTMAMCPGNRQHELKCGSLRRTDSGKKEETWNQSLVVCPVSPDRRG